MNTIAERIKFAMKVKNKKQIEIVRDTGISKGAFSSYLSGQYNPKLDLCRPQRRIQIPYSSISFTITVVPNI